MAERSLNATLYGLIIILQIIRWQKVEIWNDLIFKAIVFGDSGAAGVALSKSTYLTGDFMDNYAITMEV